MLTNRYLTEDEIFEMAEAAARAYEFNADWNAAVRAAQEYAADELGVRASRSAILLAAKQGQLNWKRLV